MKTKQQYHKKQEQRGSSKSKYYRKTMHKKEKRIKRNSSMNSCNIIYHFLKKPKGLSDFEKNTRIRKRQPIIKDKFQNEQL